MFWKHLKLGTDEKGNEFGSEVQIKKYLSRKWFHDDRRNKNGETEELMNIDNSDKAWKEIIRFVQGKAFKWEIK